MQPQQYYAWYVFFQQTCNKLLQEGGVKEIGKRRQARIIGGKKYDAVLLDILAEEFENRLRKVMDSAKGIGWGYHDGLSELYYETFPADHRAPNNRFHSYRDSQRQSTRAVGKRDRR